MFNLVRFMHDRDCTAKLKKLSGRTAGQIESWANLSLQDLFNRRVGTYETMTSHDYGKQALHDMRIGDHGRALNMNNDVTAELRLFRGSLKIEKVMGSLQFYNSVLEYTNPRFGHLKVTEKPKWLSYRNFIEDHRQPKAIKELKVMLQEAGI